MKTHSLILPSKIAPELIYEKKNFLILEYKYFGIKQQYDFGDIISIEFVNDVLQIPTGDLMMVEIQYVEQVTEYLVAVAIKPKSYSSNSFSVYY